MESSLASWKQFLPWLLGFVALVLPLSLADRSSNLSSDEAAYYLPAIERIRGHWPAIDLVNDSLSATAPGYAYGLATVSLLTGSDRLTLRLVNLVVSAGVLCSGWWILRRSGIAPPWFLLPLGLCNFFVKSAGFVVTDNAALLAIALTLGATLFAGGRPGGVVAAGCATLAVAVRQNSVWLLVPLAGKILGRIRAGGRRRELLVLLLPAIPVVVLALAWGGLVPPVWRSTQVPSGITAMPALYVLTVLATVAPAYYFALTSASQWREDFGNRWAAVAAVLALILVAVTDSRPDSAAGNWGGYWWNVAASLPAIGHAALPFAVLAPAGAWLAAAAGHRLWREAGAETALPFILSVLAWLATVLANRLVFHRYYEPMLLVFLLCWVALLGSSRVDKAPSRRWPLAALAAVQFLITLVSAHGQAYGLFRP